MADREIFRAPKYDPPYPQDFHPFWPRHAIKALIVVCLTLGAIIYLALTFPVPVDPGMPPMPNEGEFIPAPEWYLFTLFQPFWYLVGDNVSYRPIFTFWVPIGIIVGLLLTPFIFGRKRWSGARIGTGKRIVYWLMAIGLWGALMGGVWGSGYPSKTTGCVSCHNPMMGIRQALPPADMGKFFREDRARQIKVGKYNIGDTTGVGQSFKDANWQMRHFYEPTMTW